MHGGAQSVPVRPRMGAEADPDVMSQTRYLLPLQYLVTPVGPARRLMLPGGVHWRGTTSLERA